MYGNSKSKNIFFISLFLITIGCFYFFSLPVYSMDNKKEIKQAVVNFFLLLSTKKYKAAYKSFSSNLRRDIPYSEFLAKAEDIKNAHIKKLIIYDSSSNIGKLKIEAKIELIHEDKLYKALYVGTCDLVKEKNVWRVASVSLKAKEAVPVEKIEFN